MSEPPAPVRAAGGALYDGEAVQRMVRRATQFELNDEANPAANFVAHGHLHAFEPVALGCLPETSWLRQAAVWLATWRWFDRCVLLAIAANTLLLAATDYSLLAVDPVTLMPSAATSSWNAAIAAAEPVFTAAFTCEAVVKIVAMGFWGSHGYTSDGWNVLDLVIVVTSLLQSAPGMPRVSALRAFRALRPLRTLARLSGMRMMVRSLFAAIPQLLNVGVLLLVFFGVYGILAVNLLQGQVPHARCRITPQPVGIPATHLLAWDPAELPPWLAAGELQGLLTATSGWPVNGSLANSDTRLPATTVINSTALPAGQRRPLFFEALSVYYGGNDAGDTAFDSASAALHVDASMPARLDALYADVGHNDTALPWVLPSPAAVWSLVDSALDNATTTGRQPWRPADHSFLSFAQATTYLHTMVNNRTAFPWCGAGDLKDKGSGERWPAAGIPLADTHWRQADSPWATARRCVWPVDLDDAAAVCSVSGSGAYTCQATAEDDGTLPPHVQPGTSLSSMLLALRGVSRSCGSSHDDFGNPRFANPDVMALDRPPGLSDGMFSADNFGSALLMIFQCFTLEGWTSVSAAQLLLPRRL